MKNRVILLAFFFFFFLFFLLSSMKGSIFLVWFSELEPKVKFRQQTFSQDSKSFEDFNNPLMPKYQISTYYGIGFL